MKVVFFGTPEFAVPTLEAVAAHHDVVLVVAQPDRPAGRGLQLLPPAAAVRARELGLPLAQPAKIRDPQFLHSIAALHPDLGVVIAYGRILPGSLLAIPKYGFINVHASLLPRYRGAAPIQRAIAAGEATSGVTIMRVDEELDHGPMLSKAEIEIGPDEHTPSLFRRLAELGAREIVPAVDAIANGTALEIAQEHAAATLAPKIEKSEGEVRWSESARSIYDKFRAFDPWPGLFTKDGLKLIAIEKTEGRGQPGEVLEISSSGVVVAAGQDAIRIVTLQRPGKSRAPAADVARGLGWRAGALLS